MKTEDLGEGQNPHWPGRARKTLQQRVQDTAMGNSLKWQTFMSQPSSQSMLSFVTEHRSPEIQRKSRPDHLCRK